MKKLSQALEIIFDSYKYIDAIQLILLQFRKKEISFSINEVNSSIKN